MRIPVYQVDAFANQIFKGNPAAVCPLTEWLSDELMQAIAAENNLSETAFFLGGAGRYRLRWFTPAVEVRLCGHATLASAFVLWNELEDDSPELHFETLSGALSVGRQGERIVMDFPSAAARPCQPPDELVEGLGLSPQEILLAGDDSEMNYLAVYPDQQAVASLRPDMALLKRLERAGVIATAPGDETDFCSRYFAPYFGIDEDPATGSIHCTLTPYWSGRLGREDLRGAQISSRGGLIYCRDQGERTQVAGEAVLYSRGLIELSRPVG